LGYRLLKILSIVACIMSSWFWFFGLLDSGDEGLGAIMAILGLGYLPILAMQTINYVIAGRFKLFL